MHVVIVLKQFVPADLALRLVLGEQRPPCQDACTLHHPTISIGTGRRLVGDVHVALAALDVPADTIVARVLHKDLDCE